MDCGERDWLTTSEIAAEHLVRAETVVRWIRRGTRTPLGEVIRLAARKLANEWRVKKAALAVFLQALESVAPEELGETPTQLRRRGLEDQRRAAEVLGGGGGDRCRSRV